MSLRPHGRALTVAGIAALTLAVSAVTTIAAGPTPYGVLADALSQAASNGRFSISASLRGNVHGDAIDIPTGQVSLKVDMGAGRGSFTGNVGLGSPGPMESGVEAMHADESGRLKWQIHWDQRGIRVKSRGFDQLASGAPGFTSATAPDGWMGLNGSQMNNLMARIGDVAAPLDFVANLPIDGPWTQALFTGAGISADWGAQTASEARSEYRITATLDPSVLQNVITSMGGPVVLVDGGSRLMTATEANDVEGQLVSALKHTDQLKLDIRVKKSNSTIAKLEAKFKGEIDGQPAEIQLKVEFKAQSSIGLPSIPDDLESLGPLYQVAMCVLNGGTIESCTAG